MRTGCGSPVPLFPEGITVLCDQACVTPGSAAPGPWAWRGNESKFCLRKTLRTWVAVSFFIFFNVKLLISFSMETEMASENTATESAWLIKIFNYFCCIDVMWCTKQKALGLNRREHGPQTQTHSIKTAGCLMEHSSQSPLPLLMLQQLQLLHIPHHTHSRGNLSCAAAPLWLYGSRMYNNLILPTFPSVGHYIISSLHCWVSQSPQLPRRLLKPGWNSHQKFLQGETNQQADRRAHLHE